MFAAIRRASSNLIVIKSLIAQLCFKRSREALVIHPADFRGPRLHRIFSIGPICFPKRSVNFCSSQATR